LKNFRKIVLLVPLFTLGACTGMNMNTEHLRLDAVRDQGVEDAYQQRVRLVPINASLIVAQAKAASSERPSVMLPPSDDAGYEYRVGPQDVLQVTVWDHPELTTPAGQFRTSAETGNLVRQDGTIFYPYIGVVHVAGKTLEEIRRILAKKLARYIEKPQVDVRVAAFRSQKVYVTGEVMKPGVLPITDAPLHVLEAIQQAGGVVRQTGGSNVFGQQAMEADLEHVKLTRDGHVYTIDVLAMLQGGDMSANVLLKNGDVLHVPDNYGNKVFVMGEVKSPSALPIHHGRMSLAEALGLAGGVDMATSEPGNVYVIRGGELAGSQGLKADFAPTVYHLNADSPDALILADQFRLRPHDVVFVSTAPITRWGRVLNQLQGTIQSIAVIRALTK